MQPDPFMISDDFRPRRIIHIRVQQRTSRKSITIIEGLPSDLDLKKK